MNRRCIAALAVVVLAVVAPASAAQVAQRGVASRNVVVEGGLFASIVGFNANLACCQSAARIVAMETQGAFRPDNKGRWVKNLVESAHADRRSVSYTISPHAFWYWGGKKVPVTYKDFVYTLQQMDDPKNDVGGTRYPYSNLDPTHFTHEGLRRVTFYWRTHDCSNDYPCLPVANWRSLFSNFDAFVGLYPSFALKGLDFSKIWTSCICGRDGKPVSDGAYYLASHSSRGSLLKANPYWFGKKPALRTIEIRSFPDQDVLLEAMRRKQVDLANFSLTPAIAPLADVRGLTVRPTSTEFNVEFLDFREGNAPGAPGLTKGASNALLRAPWMRQAIALAIDRKAIVRQLFGGLANRIPIDDNLLSFPGQAAYRPDFSRWDYNPRKALAILKRHCTRGTGPSSPSAANTKIWRCGGVAATFRWEWIASDADRTTIEQIALADLKAVGIGVIPNPLPRSVFFITGGIGTGDFDIADYALNTSGDPSDFEPGIRCRGAGNDTGFCSARVDALFNAGDAEFNPAKRIADYQKADKILARTVPSLPLFSRRAVTISKTNLLGLEPGPAFLYTMQNWHWKR
jgi:ABC-type transport system substrate-binding protein